MLLLPNATEVFGVDVNRPGASPAPSCANTRCRRPRARVDRGFQRRSRKRGGKSTASKAPAKTRTVSKAPAKPATKKAPAKKKAKPAPA